METAGCRLFCELHGSLAHIGLWFDTVTVLDYSVKHNDFEVLEADVPKANRVRIRNGSGSIAVISPPINAWIRPVQANQFLILNNGNLNGLHTVALRL